MLTSVLPDILYEYAVECHTASMYIFFCDANAMVAAINGGQVNITAAMSMAQ